MKYCFMKLIKIYLQKVIRVKVQMQKILSPNQFLFQEAILEVLKQAKKTIKITPFQSIEPQELIKSNDGRLHIDLYHHYLVAAMTHQRTKELSCTKYEKILRENLFDRDHLPPQMISSILSACSNPGGSTTGSSHGSANISTSSQQNENLYVVNLIKTILLKTAQSSSQIQLSLNYILEGTRNKRYLSFYSSILQQIYNTVLTKNREQPVKRLVHLQVNHIINQIEYHLGIYDRDSSWMTVKYQQNGKRALCVHDQRGGKGKFGRCYICRKQADNYCKDEMVPICSFQCKNRLKELVDSENNKDFFNLMGWLIESLPSGDEIIYSFLGRQLPHHQLGLNEIIAILKIIINIFTTCAAQRLTHHTASLVQNTQSSSSSSGHYIFKQIQKHALNIFLHILFNYKHLYEEELGKYFKVFFYQIVRILELISIKRLKVDAKTPRGSKGQLPTSKESLESSLNLSLDSMGNMQSLNSMAQGNPNVASYLNYQQQFSNPFLNGIIQILSNEDLFFYIYSHFDCKFFQQNLLAKMMNVISQYAKEEIISKEYGFGITGSSAYGVYSILKMLTERIVGYEKHKNLRTFNLQEENKLVEQFLSKYPINQTEVQMKRQLPKIIELFNKKPVKGITALKKIFAKPHSQSSKAIDTEPLSESTIKESKTQGNQESQQIMQTSNISQIDFQKDVEEIKKKAEKLERENLEASQLSAREEKSVSLDNMEEPSMIESMEESIVMEESIIMESSEKGEREEETTGVKQDQKEEKLKEIKSIEILEVQLEKNKSVTEQKVSEKPQIAEQQPQPKQSKPKANNIDSFITPKQIAMLLRQNVDYDSKLKKIPLFHKEKIAQFLGSTKDKQATQICYQFFKLDQPIYSHLQIDDCLRIEFNYFGLPKQGQQIEIVIDELSKVMLPHTYFANSLNIFQYIYTLLMVQSGHNPNVKQADKVKLQMFLSMVKHIEEANDKAERDFHRIKRNSLNNLYNWGDMIFQRKYLMNVNEEDWLFQKIEEINQRKHLLKDDKNIKDSPNIINLKWLMQYMWQYVYISIVNNQKKNSTLGVFEAIVLYGKYGLVGQQFGFVQIFKRSYQYTKSKQSLQSLLRLGIEFNNYLFQWSYLINLSYLLQQSNTYHEHIDKIFTNLQFVHKSKLKIFLVALCEFSTSEYKSDKGYNRELFVLRHITEILEYNLTRLEEVWDEIWGTIEAYFKGICLHPKREISMAAIDSYKQLSLKIFKLKPSSTSSPHINHSRVLQTYLYIFERSNIFIKDLIINILQNVVSNDITSGWEIIYQIININDSQDKTVVMKVVERLVKEVGYKRLTSLQKLHQILIKQLRVNVNTVTLIECILTRLWQVSQQINQRETWLQTMRSVKDIYKMSLNNRLLGFWFRICNQCIVKEVDDGVERERRMSFDMMKSILVKPQNNQRETQQQREKSPIKQPINQSNSSQQQISIDRQIYTQIVDWLIFLLDGQANQSIQTKQSYILILKQALQHFNSIKSLYVIRYLVGASGLLNVFSMFINSQFKIVFLLFFRQFIREKLFVESQGEVLVISRAPQKYLELMMWVNQHFQHSIPSDLLNMKKLDQDFRKQRKDLIYNLQNDSSNNNSPLPSLTANSQTHKIQLIEFSLSAQDFNLKSISNLILLDCLQLTVKKSTIEQFNKKIENMRFYKTIEHDDQLGSPKTVLKSNFESALAQVYQNLVENYQISRKINSLVVLRNFLWNNGFLLYNTFKENHDPTTTDPKPKEQPQGQSNNNKLINISKDHTIKSIPGLHKHQKRTLELILSQLPQEDSYVLNIQVLQDFITAYRLKTCLDEEKATQNGLKKRKRQQSVSRGRKISQLLKHQGGDKTQSNKPSNGTKVQDQSQNPSKTPSHQQNQSNKEKPTQPHNEKLSSNIAPINSKQIKVIQYEKKSSKNTTVKPKINIIPSTKSQNSAQNAINMRQLYLNDMEQWIKMMEGNITRALRNLLKICTEALEQRQQQREEGKSEGLSSFLVNDQQMVKIFLLCLDLSGEENCSLSIMRASNTLMQRLLKTVMLVDIDYGWKDESEMDAEIEEDQQK